MLIIMYRMKLAKKMIKIKMKMMLESLRMTCIFLLQTRTAKMKLAQMSMDIGSADFALLESM